MAALRQSPSEINSVPSTEPEDAHSNIEGPRTNGTEDAQLEQRHPHQHETSHLPQKTRDEGRLSRSPAPSAPRCAICLVTIPRGTQRPRERTDAGVGVHSALQAASAAGSDQAVDHVSANDKTEAVAKAKAPSTRQFPGRQPAGRKCNGAAQRERDEHVAVPDEVVHGGRPMTSRTLIRLMCARQADTTRSPESPASMTMLTPSSIGEDRDELTVGEESG